MIRFLLAAMGRVAAVTLLAMALVPLSASPHTTRTTAKKTVVKSSRVPEASRTAERTSAHSAGRVSTTRTTARTTTHVTTHVTTRGGRSVRTTKVARVAAGPSYQLHPEPTRYTEIQKALADRGYFKGDPNGVWGDDSSDAMRRFQADQKIDETGKIDARSLISLGLGPRHDGSRPVSSPSESSSSSLQPQSATAVATTASQPR